MARNLPQAEYALTGWANTWQGMDEGGVKAMFGGWAQVVLGWPAIVASMGAAVCGIIRCQPVWLHVGAVLILGFSWYLGNTPRFRGVGLLLPLLFVGASFAVQRGRRMLGLLLLAPFFVLTLWLAWAVLSQ